MDLDLEGRKLQNAILDDPHDVASQLAYAKWLEEHGNKLFGRFIRDQLRLAGETPCIYRKRHAYQEESPCYQEWLFENLLEPRCKHCYHRFAVRNRIALLRQIDF